ncbi:hypothetical protein NL450_27425, partial [Klebsiella pneumoniae]|nr:hypothetical protein [Klebsiella pneumoniae]
MRLPTSASSEQRSAIRLAAARKVRPTTFLARCSLLAARSAAVLGVLAVPMLVSAADAPRGDIVSLGQSAKTGAVCEA